MKVIIVEGKSDKGKILQILDEEVDILCTNGTLSITKLEEMVEELYYEEVYIFVDEDDAGMKLRKQLKSVFPNAKHLYIDKNFREVEDAPLHHIAQVLQNAYFQVKNSLG